MFQYVNPRRINKMYSCFCHFIGAIRNGKEPIIFGPGYVAMSQKHYDKLKSNQSHFKFVGIDEYKPLNKENKKCQQSNQ